MKAFEECSLHSSAAFLQRSGPVLQAHSVFRGGGKTVVVSQVKGSTATVLVAHSVSAPRTRR